MKRRSHESPILFDAENGTVQFMLTILSINSLLRYFDAAKTETGPACVLGTDIGR
jgi:hypothetical protein